MHATALAVGWRETFMKDRLLRFVNLLHILLINFSKILLIGMILIVFANVVLRYVFNSGILWSEEVALLFEVWFIFLSLGLGVKQRLHISINMLPRNRIDPRLDKALDLLSELIFILVGIVLIIFGIRLTQFTMRSIMPATKWPAGILYMVTPLSGLLVIVESMLHILKLDTYDANIDRYLSGEGKSIGDIFDDAAQRSSDTPGAAASSDHDTAAKRGNTQ